MTSIRVLIADDHTLFRHGIISALTNNEDLEVVGEATDGLEAIEKTRKLDPDVVMMDIKMPGVDGIELTRQVKRKYPSSNIIMLTLYDQYLAQAMEAGARGYLLKDIKRDELTNAIRKVHSGQVVIGESIKSSALLEYKERLNGKKDENENFNDWTEEIQIVLCPPIDARQLMKLANRTESELNSRVLQMVGSWQEGTIMTVIMNKAMTHRDILNIVNNMPEIEAVEEEYNVGQVNQQLIKKAKLMPKLRDRMRKTLFVTLKTINRKEDESCSTDYNPSRSLYISS